MITARKSSGNMTVLVSLTFGVVVAVCVVGLIVNSMFFQRTRDQHRADALAVELAESLNAQNRIGQINELQSYSRELVFVSRQEFQNCTDQEPLLAPLANQLLDEARNNQHLIAAERDNLSEVIAGDAKNFVRDYNSANAAPPFSVPWISAKNFQIRDLKLGSIRDIRSNVFCSDAVPELARRDRNDGFVDSRSGLFQSEIFVPLPFDSDLKYQFAALPACVKLTCAPARNTDDDVFRDGRFSRGLLPTAVQIDCGSEIAIGSSTNSEKLHLKSTAITSGAPASSD